MSESKEDLISNNPFLSEDSDLSKDFDLSKDNPFLSDNFELSTPQKTEGYGPLVFSKITAPILGSVVGGGVGYAEKIAPKKEAISSVINEINNLVASGKIQEAKILAQIKLGGGLKKTSDVEDIFDLYQRASGPKIEGASGVSNYTRSMAGQTHQLPENLIAQAEDYTKTNPKGAHAIIQEDLKNLEKIKSIGGGDYELTARGPGQIMVPNKVAQEVAEKSASFGQPIKTDFSRQIEEIKDLISQGRKSEAISKWSSLFGGGPIKGGIIGGLGGLQLAGAAQAAKEGDIPTAAIQGAGGLGSLATLIPKALPRLIGGGAAVASIPAQFVYEAIKGIPKERMENVSARQQFEAMPAQPSEQEIMKARISGPALSRMNLQMQNPTRFAGGLRNIQ